ncbi:MAG: enoyl-CoA hydratase [Dehalococcoidia bacterium]|nr:enoyl-CoA hydratase [Dehalococcoidia bacterium]
MPDYGLMPHRPLTEKDQFLLYEKDPPIARIILNRPEKMNALRYDLRLEIKRAMKRAEADGDIRVIILKGAGRTFSAGYDMTPMPAGEHSMNTPPVYVHPDLDNVSGQYVRDLTATYWVLWDLLKPVIAQVHGYCLAGGTELASFCDIRVVAESAQIGYPVVRNVSIGNVQWQSWIMGLTKAKEFMLTGDSMDGKEAYRVGWATRVVPDDKLEAETEALARRIAMIPTDLIMMTKRSINRQFEIMGLRAALDTTSDLISATQWWVPRGDFGKIARERGLKAALSDRDSKFGDYRTNPNRPDPTAKK